MNYLPASVDGVLDETVMLPVDEGVVLVSPTVGVSVVGDVDEMLELDERVSPNVAVTENQNRTSDFNYALLLLPTNQFPSCCPTNCQWVWMSLEYKSLLS